MADIKMNFNGNVNIEKMFDIHDNQKVTINNSNTGNTLNQAGKNDGEKEKPEKKKKGFMDKVKEAFDD